jgi:hypothetical protein
MLVKVETELLHYLFNGGKTYLTAAKKRVFRSGFRACTVFSCKSLCTGMGYRFIFRGNDRSYSVNNVYFNNRTASRDDTIFGFDCGSAQTGLQQMI